MVVKTAKTYRSALVAVKQIDKILVYLTAKHHLNDVYRFFIGVTKAVYELALLADFFQHCVYFGSAAVYKHYLDTAERQQNKVRHYRLLQLIVCHCVTAVLDYYYLV